MSRAGQPTMGREVVRHGDAAIATLSWLQLRDDDASLARAGRLCSADEQARARRLRLPRDRRRALLRRAAARRLVAWQVRRPADSIDLRRDAAGRPFLAGSGLALSISYADDWVLVATSPAAAIGCDLANPTAAPERWPGADETFAAAEVAWIDARQTADDARAAFTKVWTLKEACGKAVGRGLAGPLHRFDTLTVCERVGVVAFEARDWLSRSWERPDGYWVAIVVAQASGGAIHSSVPRSGERERSHAC